jgi:GMP synthase (glutamine-hydrolysing)
VRVLVLAHGREIEPGWLLDALAEVAADHALVDLSLGDPVPLGPWDKIVVLGGHMGAYDVDEHPWLAAEKELIRMYLADETPLLGVCLGAQMVADVIGGRAYRAPGTEAGLITLQRTAAGEEDPVIAAVSGPVVAWHHDTFELPAEAELLAFTADYPHAFRHGSALGVQFHPEVTPGMWERWVASAGAGDLVAAGLDPDEFAKALSADAGRLRAQAVEFFRTWLEE